MDTTILDCLDAAASGYPLNIAYKCKDEKLTFSDLSRLTKSVGTALCAHITPGHPVAVLTGRNVTTPAVYMGVLRAGCFYAPVDTQMPDARIIQILQTLDTPCLVTDKDFLPRIDNLGFEGEILLAEDLTGTTPDENLLENARKDITDISPMYVIFTSGSTGAPKGVVTSHHALLCYLDAVSEVLDLTEEDVLGNQSPLDYIAAIRDMYLPVLTGCSTVMIPKEDFSMPEALFSILNENKITTLCWSCAGMELVSRMGGFEGENIPRYLRRVIFSGSVIANKCLRDWQEHLPECRFINQYGPTETTASCTYHEITNNVNEDTKLPIGKAYKHYRVFVVSDGKIVDTPNTEGEICVAGPCLALGYYRNPEATEKVFVKSQFCDGYEEKVYKTGDLGYYGEDGLLYFTGRIDRQIKYMGHRVELDDVESTVLAAEGVKDCAVVFDENSSMLCLMYEGDASKKDISLYLRQVLPAFMVPRKIVQTDGFPRLPNGKKDRKSVQQFFERR